MNYLNQDEIVLHLKCGSQINERIIIESGHYFEEENGFYRVIIDKREFIVNENFIQNYKFEQC